MIYKMNTDTWSVERVMYLVGGLLVIAFAILALTLDVRFLWGDVFVGGMLCIFALTGYCPGAILMAKILKK